MNRLKELRLERNLSQEDVANGIGTRQSNIGRWENETNEPAAGFLIKLADFFAVSVDYLLGRSDDFGNVTLHRTDLAADSLDRELLEHFRKLDVTGKNKVIGYAYALAH